LVAEEEGGEIGKGWRDVEEAEEEEDEGEEEVADSGTQEGWREERELRRHGEDGPDAWRSGRVTGLAQKVRSCQERLSAIRLWVAEEKKRKGRDGSPNYAMDRRDCCSAEN
jgi:hypothetical protein